MVISLFYFNGCSLLNFYDKQTKDMPRKHYIGRASTENFQKGIGEVLLGFDYHIEQYDNGPTSSYIITRWKIREGSEDSLATEFKESKTRLIINGMIDNQSFEMNNGFSYDCFLEIQNFTYNGSDFIPNYEDTELKIEISNLIKKLSSFLSINQ